MFKVGEFVYFIDEDTDYTCSYFGRIKAIAHFKNLLDEDDYQYTLEVLYEGNGLELLEPLEKVAITCDLKPAEESLDRLIQRKQNEIKALTRIYKEM